MYLIYLSLFGIVLSSVWVGAIIMYMSLEGAEGEWLWLAFACLGLGFWATGLYHQLTTGG